MRVIARNVLVAFGEKHPGASASLDRWFRVAKAADWKTTSQVQATFPKAKVLNDERVRFEVAGGDFRMIVSFDFTRQIAYIKFLGTHAEYDRVDAMAVSLF
jgi:mRNA interferase HigB